MMHRDNKREMGVGVGEVIVKLYSLITLPELCFIVNDALELPDG